MDFPKENNGSFQTFKKDKNMNFGSAVGIKFIGEKKFSVLLPLRFGKI